MAIEGLRMNPLRSMPAGGLLAMQRPAKRVCGIALLVPCRLVVDVLARTDNKPTLYAVGVGVGGAGMLYRPPPANAQYERGRRAGTATGEVRTMGEDQWE